MRTHLVLSLCLAPTVLAAQQSTVYLAPWTGVLSSAAQQFTSYSAPVTLQNFDTGYVHGQAVSGFTLGHIGVTMRLRDTAGVVRATTTEVFNSTFFNVSGIFHQNAILNRAITGAFYPRMELAFSEPVKGVGFYVFDDGSDDQFTITVINGDGVTEGPFVLHRQTPFNQVEGFVGVAHPHGISAVTVENQGVGGGAPSNLSFMIDTIQLGPPVPKDTSAPIVSISSPAPGRYLATTSIAVAGDVVDQSASTVASAPSGVSAGLPAGGGSWSGVVPLDFEGANTITIAATDEFGNRGGSSVTVVRDTAAPVGEFLSPPEGAVLGSLSATFSLRVVDASPSQVAFADGAIGVAAGEQVATRTLALLPGANTITVTVTDAAGNTTQIARSVVVDLDVPVVTVLSPAGGTWFGAGQQVAPITVRIDDLSPTTVTSTPTGIAATLPAGGGIATGAVALVEGFNSIQVRAADPIHAEGSATLGVHLDTIAPHVTLTSPSAFAKTRGTVDVAATAVDGGIGVAQVQFALDGLGSPFATITAAPYEAQLDTRDLPEGTHSLVATAFDHLGNVASTVAVPFVVDNVAPTIVLVSPAVGSTVAGTVDVRFRLDDTNTGTVAATCLVNGLAPSPIDPSFDGFDAVAAREIVVREDTTRHTDGPLVIHVRTTDAAGNGAEAVFGFTVANSLPPACELLPVSGSVVAGVVPITATVAGAFTNIELRVDGVAIGSSASSPFTVPFDSSTRLDGAMRVDAVVHWGQNESVITTAILTVDNVAVGLCPETLNLRAKSDQANTPVMATLTGSSVGMLLPTETHGIGLRIRGGGLVTAVAGWSGDDAVENGTLKVRFERALVAQAVQAALTPAPDARSTVVAELWAGASATTPGFLLGTVALRVIR